MTYLKTWEEFEKTAENLYLQNSLHTRFVVKYNHSQSCLEIKVTDNSACVQYKVEMLNEVKKLEKFVSKLVSHMASKEV